VSWRQNLRTPSYNGIRFQLWNAEREGGRTTVTHEFIGRDRGPYSEDVARTPRTFSLEVFLSGFDYFRQRDRLITELEKPGPGTLVHPYYGSLQVNVTRFRIRETGSEGNIVRFSIDFVEAGSLSFPTVSKSKGGLLSEIREAIETASSTEFVKKYTIDNLPDFVTDSAIDKITELADTLSDVAGIITASSDRIADLAVAIHDLRGDIDNLINTPAILATRMVSALSLLGSSITNTREGFEAYGEIFDYGSDDPIITQVTASRIQQDTNNKAFTNFVRVMALSGAVSSASEIEFVSEEDAEVIRQVLYDEMDSLMERVDDDATFAELNNLRTFVSLNIPPEDQALPRIYDYANLLTRPALVIAYEQFGDVLSEQDLIDRNNVSNPNYVPGGVTLRILGRV
jgi:prophage DNA circulation protein